MPTFLSDPPTALYAVLAVAFVIALAVWYRRRDRKSLIAVGVTGLLLLGLYLIDVVVESPREEAIRRTQVMADAATACDAARFVGQLSPAFNYNGANRDKVKNSPVWELIRQHNARVAVWGFGRSDFVQHGDNEVEIGFYCKAEANGGGVFRFVRARFVRDPDGVFRLKTMKFYSTEGGLNKEDPIPGFP